MFLTTLASVTLLVGTTGDLRDPAVDLVTYELAPLGIQTMHLSPFADTDAAIARLERRAAFVEVDRLVPPADFPSDPYFPKAWHLKKIGATTLWADPARSSFGWLRRFGDESQIIAIIDSGVGPNDDLAGRLVPGWNVYDNSADTHDVYGHGTQCAGSAAADGNNALGIASVSWYTRIMPIRASEPNGSAYLSKLAQGLIWASDHGATIASLSFFATTSVTVNAGAKYFYEGGGGSCSQLPGTEASNLLAPTVPGSLPLPARTRMMARRRSRRRASSWTSQPPRCPSGRPRAATPTDLRLARRSAHLLSLVRRPSCGLFTRRGRTRRSRMLSSRLRWT